jgi:hypothetical protein
MPDFNRLVLKGFKQPRMSMSQCIDSNAAAEIEIRITVVSKQPTAVTPFERERKSGEDGEEMRLRLRSHLFSFNLEIRLEVRPIVLLFCRPEIERKKVQGTDT